MLGTFSHVALFLHSLVWIPLLFSFTCQSPLQSPPLCQTIVIYNSSRLYPKLFFFLICIFRQSYWCPQFLLLSISWWFKNVYLQSRLLPWLLDQNFQLPDQLCKVISGHFKVIISKTILRYFLFLPQTWSSSTILCLGKSPPPPKFLPPDRPLALPISDSDELTTMVSGLASRIH